MATGVLTPHSQVAFFLIQDISPNSVHIALQIPMYVLITAGEIMFSVTGLDFAYSQVGHACGLGSTSDGN